MSNLIILRLHPVEPTDGDSFKTYLEGLEITVADRSYADPKGKVNVLGTAQYLAEGNPAATILQHRPGMKRAPAATAALEVPAPLGFPEYVGPDLVLTITRTVPPHPAQTILHHEINFNVEFASGPLPPSDPALYAKLGPVALYLPVPKPMVGLSPGVAYLEVPTDGTPPPFSDLMSAVHTVLAKDPGALPDLTALTPERCRHIAYEIVSNRTLDPLPQPPGSKTLEELYSGNAEDDRRKFEGDLQTYYTVHNTQAEALAKFIFSMSAALGCAKKSQQAKQIGFTFPILPGLATKNEKIAETTVVLTQFPSFNVPAPYFYALAASMPPDVAADVRYRMACLADEKTLLGPLRKAIDDGSIAADPVVTPEMAARRLHALGSTQGPAPVCAPGVGLSLVQAYTAYKTIPPKDDPSDDIAPFWAGVMSDPSLAAAQLELVLCAVTQEADARPLILDVKAEGLTLISVKNLDATPWPGPPAPALDVAAWTRVFTDHPGDLPAITAPGTLDERISAFVRRLRKFFDILSIISGPVAPTPDGPPRLDLPTFDPIERFFLAYTAQPGQAGFAFGQPLDETALQAALALVPMDGRGRHWLEQAVRAINDLHGITDVVSTNELHFALTEALYARGFQRAAEVSVLSLADFRKALLGTPAYPFAASIYAKAGGSGGLPVPAPGDFHPINSDGTLTDCVPPPQLSPLGAVAYLYGLLNVSTAATCDDPAPEDQAPTLGSLLQARRGPLGDLLVTRANAETPLLVVDLVNECLEAMVATSTPSGVVYDTAADILAGHALRGLDAPADDEARPFRHDPATLFAALPEHSSPAIPVGQPGAYAMLATDFSAPSLPYAQALDVNRSTLRALGASRYEVMRHFRQGITEFVLDPAQEPADFPRHVWRYPVRIDIARESLGISHEEYDLLFTQAPSGAMLAQLYGFTPAEAGWEPIAQKVSEFLARTGLSYCQFLELWRSAYVKFHGRSLQQPIAEDAFPVCEPCYLDKLRIVFDDPSNPDDALARLAVFIRLWRKLQDVPHAKYSFAELRDICDVLQLFRSDGSINRDFIRQLVAFQMLRDDFHLELADPSDASPGVDEDRTHLLALWVGPSAHKWGWAVERLVARVEHHARTKHERKPRKPEFLKLLAGNLDPLSRLAGFDPSTPARTWHALPAHTLRFAEVLSKVYTSHFGVGEILYLFTADPHLAGDDPFPLEEADESQEDPLNQPEDVKEFSLWSLRRKLLDVDPSDEEVERWTWARIEAALRHDLGFAPPPGGPDTLVALGMHFFPNVIERHGATVPAKDRRFAVPLAGSAAAMWNTPDSPFSYDAASSELRAEVPLRDESVLNKLGRIRPLVSAEQHAVRDLYYLPRLDIARFAFLFPSLGHADTHLVQEPEEERRWHYFQHHFVQFYERCKVIAQHLAEHVQTVTDHHGHHTQKLAWKLLVSLLADENKANPPPWEADDGKPPQVTWDPSPVGGAFAALVGLVGTGLLGEVRVDDGKKLVWRELRGPTAAFGEVRDAWNVPVPMIVPALDFALTIDQERWAGSRNGITLAAANAKHLGGAQPYCVTWRGVLLVEEGGTYRFWAGAPTPEGEKPDVEHVHGRRWRVTLQRGQKCWVLLSHGWPDEANCPCSAALPLKHGAYELTIEFVRCPPTDDDLEDAHAQRTGFQLKYEGPDTGNELATVPRRRLYIAQKDATLASGLGDTSGGVPQALLQQVYTSTLRDVRRTYQRAFKALLFAHRFALSPDEFADYAQSEIGYLQGHPDKFAGLSFYDKAGAWTAHRAFFDFNLFPLKDDAAPPPPAQDDRVAPSAKREQALFDLWERTFDYVVLRERARKAPEHPVWLLFDEASENQPDNPAQLLRHVDVNLTHADLVLHYGSGYAVTANDLTDERWAIRIWHADRCLGRMVAHFLFADVRAAKPDLWAADEPGTPGGGNENLTKVVQDGLIENDPPRRYEDLKRLNDGLRERARGALLAYLCGMDRVPLPWPGGGYVRAPKQLSELLLLDVEVGLCERASRVEEAITAVQILVQRARLGLEPPWVPSPGFIAFWDSRFAIFRAWQACTRRLLYRENWIAWDELENARRTEAFRFLEDQLRRATLTVPIPGGLEYWDGDRPPAHPGLVLLQAREPSAMRQLEGPREGLNLLGTPERSAQRSWLAPLRGQGSETGDQPGPIGRATRSAGTGTPAARATLPPTVKGKLPLWLEAAIRLGMRFVRVAAAGGPPASMPFAPRGHGDPCCKQCGCVHEAVVDEVYFWLADTRWFQMVEQNADWDGWHVRDALPRLLEWPSKPMVHLMWCHLHNGEIQQPRRSVEGVRVPDGTLPSATELLFEGRSGDSLLFRVASGILPPGHPAPPDPGFRYDLATDAAVVVPPVLAVPPIPLSVGGLSAYPYFAYFALGAPLFPLTPFSEAVSVAATLRAHCRFEAALKWYALAFDPLHGDDRWCSQSSQPSAQHPPATHDTRASRDHHRAGDRRERLATPAPDDATCCRHAGASEEIARHRAITLDYLETLLAWGDCLMQRNAPEAFQQARLVYDTAAKILGPTPLLVALESPATPPFKVSAFVPEGAPLNPRLMSVYERIGDRLSLIHACLNARRLRSGRPRLDMPYFGDAPVRDGWKTSPEAGACAPEDCCCPGSPYRFTSLVQKANELASEVRAFGNALLAAYEKGDAEHLAYVRAGHEHQILTLARAIRQDQWRDADWQVQALRKTKEIAQTNRLYYAKLLTDGLNTGELDYENLTNAAIASLTAATVSEGIGTAMGVIPDVFVGTSDFVQLPVGSKLAGVFTGLARISSQVAQILSTTAGLRMTQGGWDRREVEWQHQVEVFDLEIEQVERQILAAERRRDAARRELESQERQIENAREVLDVLRDKFTSHQLYLWLQCETAALYYQMYELARCAALQAERAFNFERGYTTRHFVPVDAWDNLREGLLAGERLQLATRRMEKAYLDENVREYELTKHVSLRLCFAHAFLALKLTGTCVVELPEWFFDLDYPGHYMRRIKNVSLTIPCVVGPYDGVRCRLTLLSSVTRIDPRLHGPAALCCKDQAPAKPLPPVCGCWPAPRPSPKKSRPDATTNGYVLLPEDPRIVRHYAATEAIATSSGQNDAGMFELNFRDERYFPFEFAGVVSRWRIELPPENNTFDIDSLSDVILHVNYTAREGGEVLRRAASEVAQARIPDDGRRVFDLKCEMSDAWRRFQAHGDGEGRHFDLRLGRAAFPSPPGDRDLWITRLELLVEAQGAEPSTHQEVELLVAHETGCRHEENDEHEFQIVGGSAWPSVYHGAVDVRLGPLRGSEERRLGVLKFEERIGTASRAFLIVHYETR